MSDNNNNKDKDKENKDNNKLITNKRKKVNDVVWFWANDCKYSVILDRVQSLGWQLIEDEKKESRCNVFWVDVSTINERFRTISSWQIINHFPGMPNIARKNRMGQNLNRMIKVFPKEYSYYPRTWVLPGELSEFRSQFDNYGNSIGNKIYIIKPDAGCQGRGITLIRQFDQVPQQENVVAQLYIKKPLLIEGFKFDLRLYIFVTSIRPLRMYLFNDGLVRICTEEYVKPSKQNLSMMCMHLTNYAVNKKNDKFQQATGADDEGGTKRSLEWFMTWIRSEYGESKANWLWKRFGVLAVRTLLSIMPTLAREYDYHFKEFNNVPVHPPANTSLYTASSSSKSDDKSSNRSKYSRSGNNNNSNNSNNNNIIINNKSRKSRTRETNSDNDHDEDDADHDEDDGDGHNFQRQTDNSHGLAEESGNDGEDVDNSEEDKEENGGGDDEENNTPCENWRGSRCFEVLGIDVMVDSQLRPWLIEFNHLPSFGTDSPLDADIKGRLMEEVFRVINARPDDEQMYQLYHKMEAERRLLADRNAAAAAKLKEKLEREKKEEAERIGRERWSKRRAEAMREREKQRESSEAAAAAAAEAVSITRERERNLQLERLQKQQLSEDTPVPPERLKEIINVLTRVYEIYCPQKLNKIDKLLAKYVGREEEFVAFVFDKYDVPYELMPTYILELPPKVETSDALTTNTQSTTTDSDIIIESTPDPVSQEETSGLQSARAQSNSNVEKSELEPTPKSISSKVKENVMQKKNRSLSPPRKKANTVWKGAPEDDEAFRAEIMAQYVPTPDNKWLLFDDENLPSFTRIFPLPVTKVDEKQNDEEPEGAEADADGDDEKVEEEKSIRPNTERSIKSKDNGPDLISTSENKDETSPIINTNGNNNTEKKTLQQTYEDILFHVFLQDRRQTLRLKCPLGSNRSKSFERPTDNSSTSVSSGRDKDSLPALNEPTSARKKSAQGSGRSLPGWRPPPPREKREAQPKLTSAYQNEIANKLSRGLSSLSSQSEENKPIRASNRVIVSAKHRLYSNTATNSASAAGYVYSHYSQPLNGNMNMNNNGNINGNVNINGNGNMNLNSNGQYLQYQYNQSNGNDYSLDGGNSNNVLWSGRGIGEYYDSYDYNQTNMNGSGGIGMNSNGNINGINQSIPNLLQQSSIASVASSSSIGGNANNRNITVAKLTAATTVKQKTFTFDSKVTANTAFGESSTVFSGGYGHVRHGR